MDCYIEVNLNRSYDKKLWKSNLPKNALKNFFSNISALQFSKALAQLDAVQQKLEIRLSNNQKLLNETKAKFADNVERIQKNFETIDQRLTAFKKWSVSFYYFWFWIMLTCLTLYYCI